MLELTVVALALLGPSLRSQPLPHRARTPALAAPPPPLNQDDLSAAALVAGTAIGGGFLALPYTTAPAGAAPSACILVGCWLLLNLQSAILAELLIGESASNDSGGDVSYSSLARSTLGGGGERAVGTLFVVLMVATLASQLSKAGGLVAPLLGLPYAAGVVGVAASLAAFSAANTPRLVSRANGVLTAGFAASLAVLCAFGARLADPALLVRADWAACPASIPSVLQLLVFCEVIPTLVALLGSRARVRRALRLGSTALLAIQLCWSTLGIALAPYDAAASGLAADPIAGLLALSSPVAAAVTALGLCASTTTVLGTNLALRQFFDDASADDDGPERRRRPARAGAFFALATLVPALAAASSADVFYAAIDFAGAYPVALLWLAAPPLMALRRADGASLPPRPLLFALVAGALAFVGFNLATDGARLLGLAGAVGRWQRG